MAAQAATAEQPAARAAWARLVRLQEEEEEVDAQGAQLIGRAGPVLPGKR